MYTEESNCAAALLQPYLPHHSATACQQSGSLGMRLG